MWRREFVSLGVGAANYPDLQVTAGAIAQNVMTVHRRPALLWCRLKLGIAEWRCRAHSRRELMNLSDRCLQDIGMSRCTADYESYKPFWMV
jgi:uncharacterized protein YjiS (DUF1127 family)